ncbi:MAG: M50 family metallopeptidase [Candidatus Nanopelagicaceae bacterium]
MELLGVVGVLAFIIALLASVMIHEAGHYFTAKRYGMKVTEFFLGFGARIWSTRRGETEFGIKAIPAGGYCKIVGMTPHEEIAEEDKGRTFLGGTIRERLVVLGAGSFLHFVLGFILIFTLFVGVGINQALNRVDEVVPCIVTTNEGECLPDSAKSPALVAGIQEGDEIVAIRKPDEQSITVDMKWEDVLEVIRSSPNEAVIVTVVRESERFEVALTLGSRTVAGETRGVIGIISSYGIVRLGPIEGTIESARFVGDVVKGSATALFRLPVMIPDLINQTFGDEERDPEGLVGVVGVARTTGEISSSERLDFHGKVVFFLLIVAGLNIFVGIFNLLPILPLDGGHMAVAIVDGVRRANAKRKGRSAPPPVDVEKLTPITLIVVVLMISLTVLLLLADIINPVRLGL